ncbi:hypothetical protein M422DRAFT_274638 [Sphaerobolus stellatus SS14]|uniref:Uncharacterized protein n=1 Tax=Sphaerobolus stellatus (strain SS14) TaxID=990650 RepID=A0A0C9UGJ8_SPHS4|nr:hypothetical protein M422DRAFT_274638 [Sphaerobolus stellatus SS14]
MSQRLRCAASHIKLQVKSIVVEGQGMDLPSTSNEEPSTPRRPSKPFELFDVEDILAAVGSDPYPTPSFRTMGVWLGVGETASPTPTSTSTGALATPTRAAPGKIFKLLLGEEPAPLQVQTPTKTMYAGVVDHNPEAYSETQYSSDLMGSPELRDRRQHYHTHIRTWESPRARYSRWACRANFHEKDWWYLDELIKSGLMFPKGPAKDLTITQNGPITLDLSHPARRADQCLLPVTAYIQAVTQATNASHRPMNRIQGELKILWDDLQRVLNHLPLVHA